ncbi:MAG: hypothetical protein ACP5JW_05595 [Candidatus Bathyarchaeia archaeon]
MWVEPALILMFEAQILTFVFSALAMLRMKRTYMLPPLILNIFIVFNMWLIAQATTNHAITEFKAGFWLTIPSTAAYLTAITLSSKRNKLTTVETKRKVCGFLLQTKVYLYWSNSLNSD